MSSSDAAKIGRAARDSERRVVEGKKKDCDGLQAGRKCCFKASKKVDFDACCCKELLLLIYLVFLLIETVEEKMHFLWFNRTYK